MRFAHATLASALVALTGCCSHRHHTPAPCPPPCARPSFAEPVPVDLPASATVPGPGGERVVPVPGAGTPAAPPGGPY